MAVLMAWIADLEEQLLISGVQHLSCPVCTAVYHNLAETDGCGVRCRRDNGSVCDPPIYAGFGPQNITVIMSQESHYWNAFLIRIHFPHPPKYGSYGSYYTPLERYE